MKSAIQTCDAQAHRVFRKLAAVGVAGLPRGALVEIDAILHAG